jgi:predicted DNA binding protein
MVMWTCKFRIYDKENEIREVIEKNKNEVYYYPVNHYIKGERHFFILMGIVQGGNRNGFFAGLKELKKQGMRRRVESLEAENDFFVMITSHTMNEEQRKYVNLFYNPAIIHYRPIMFHKNGWEEWEIASMERKPLEDIIHVGREIYELELLRFRQERIKNFGFLTMLPELTEKQKGALKLALEHGYYMYPRKMSLDKLAKQAGLSFSTFQAHIRKAENKILSFVIGSSRNRR